MARSATRDTKISKLSIEEHIGSTQKQNSLDIQFVNNFFYYSFFPITIYWILSTTIDAKYVAAIQFSLY